MKTNGKNKALLASLMIIGTVIPSFMGCDANLGCDLNYNRALENIEAQKEYATIRGFDGLSFKSFLLNQYTPDVFDIEWIALKDNKEYYYTESFNKIKKLANLHKRFGEDLIHDCATNYAKPVTKDLINVIKDQEPVSVSLKEIKEDIASGDTIENVLVGLKTFKNEKGYITLDL